MIYKQHKNGSYNIHTIKTNRFKSVRMEIIFRNNIDPKTIARRTCLFDMLLENNEYYKTKRDLVLKQEELYNAVCYDVNSKVGNQAITSICMEFLNPKYCDEDMFSEAIKLPFDLINHPNVTNNEFDADTLKTVISRLESDLKCVKEDPQKLSINRALRAMDENSISGKDIVGTLEDLKEITPSNLYETYLEVLKHDYVDIFIIGDIDMDRAIDEINKNATFKTIKNHRLFLDVDNSLRKKTNIVTEKSKFAQTQIVMILNTLNLTEDERRYAFIIYNMILGGGSLETKLAKNLREKNSLCYNVMSIYQKYDNLVLIHTAIDGKNVDKTIKLIKSSIDEMSNGNVSEEEINNAVRSVITSINMSLDMPGRIIDQYLFGYIADLEPIETRINKYKELTIQDIIKVAKKISINTVYVLEGGNRDE